MGHERLSALFERFGRDGRKALVVYLCVGDPTLEESLELARACLHAGADILELGVPFSDPTADGPTIARASQRAIAKGGGLAGTLRMARALRAESEAPLVLFGYYNPLFVRGDVRAAEEAADSGVDGLLVVDLPLEEGARLRDAARARGVAVVPLLAPTSSPDRVERVKEAAKSWPLGFLYYVSVTGVTGASSIVAQSAGAHAAALRKELGLPVVVGFGIDSGEKARAAARGTDGVVVGTAVVRAIERGADARDRTERVERLVRELRGGLDGP
jgi:tryptophan synthase alpha chain